MLFTTCITMAEVFYGIALLPAGRRKADLAADAQRMFRDDFGPRLLAFDTDAAVHYGAILAERSRGGRPMGNLDAQIAAIALTAGASVATRNVDDFTGKPHIESQPTPSIQHLFRAVLTHNFSDVMGERDGG
jgi:predicted nucleic acid-binding protein